MARRPRGLLLACAVALCAASLAHADTQALSCTENTSPGTAWSCENFGTVSGKANVTYQLAVQASDAQYQRFDVNITLTSLSGDADLCGPGLGCPFICPKWQHMPYTPGSAAHQRAAVLGAPAPEPLRLGAARGDTRRSAHLGS